MRVLFGLALKAVQSFISMQHEELCELSAGLAPIQIYCAEFKRERAGREHTHATQGDMKAGLECSLLRNSLHGCRIKHLSYILL